MQAGVSTASLFMRKYNEEALPLLNGLGVPCAEVFLTSFSEYGKEFGDLLASKKGDLKINSVHALNTEFEPQLFSAHPRVQTDAYAWAEKVLQAANALQAPYYTFHGTTRMKKAARTGENDDFPSMIKGFEKLTDFCTSRGVTLCLENVEWSTYNRVGVFNVLSSAIPNLRGVLDIKQARISGTPYYEYNNLIDETFAQELIDQFVMKLRMVRHLRMQSYNDIFAGDPTWITESIGGRFTGGKSKVTKTSFRFLQTLYNLGPAPEPNMTVLWHPALPEGFKRFCAQVSIDTSSVQYENDSLMRKVRGCDDYGIACCVSYQAIGKAIQFFGARANLAKALLLAINGGRCENTGTLMVEGIKPLKSNVLDFEEVMENYKKVLHEVARVYNETMNIIHFMHDKYDYEKSQMAFIDTNPTINLAYGVAGLSIVADSLSAIKYAKVTARRNSEGLTEGFDIEGDFPKFGNDDDRVDVLARDVVQLFDTELCSRKVYKGAQPTLSLLTITSNVMYGKKTGATPDGRAKGVAFAPGANPMHGRDTHGAIASLSSVAKLDYHDAKDGISNTFSIVPKSLGPTNEDKLDNLITMMDGYFTKGAHHLNVNVLNREMLEDAMEHPEKYPQLTIRVSGYAVNFIRLSREHQLEVISRTFHESLR